MKSKILTGLLAAALLFSINACKNNDSQKTENNQSVQSASSASAPAKKDTLSISAGDEGVSVRSGKVDVNVNKKSTDFKNKDVKVHIGDKK